MIENATFDDKQTKIEKIAKLYNVGYDFLVHEPIHFPRVMQENNIKNFLFAIKDHIRRIQEYNEKKH